MSTSSARVPEPPASQGGPAGCLSREAVRRLDPEFCIVVSAHGNATLVVPRGELDIATTPDLEAVLIAQSGPVVVDLREVTFADATALHALMRADERSRQNGMNVAFIAGHAVQRLIDAIGVRDPLTVIEPPTP
jgi:anti-anti-sigma factor